VAIGISDTFKFAKAASTTNSRAFVHPHFTAATASGIPTAPDGGALAYVLRTGFGSSQGSLLQMIEFSQQTVAGGFHSPQLLLCAAWFLFIP
jgi:hypothetical protein